MNVAHMTVDVRSFLAAKFTIGALESRLLATFVPKMSRKTSLANERSWTIVAEKVLFH
jgi:hypothetical protein